MTLMWPLVDIRISELAMTPDGNKLVAIGMLPQPTTVSNDYTPTSLARATLLEASSGNHASSSGTTNGNSRETERRIVVYDLETRQEIW